MDRLGAAAPLPRLVCLSHLPWDLVFQRPQHLLTRATRDYDVLYVEEPRQADVGMPLLGSRRDPSGVEIATPLLPPATAFPARAVRALLDGRLQGVAREELVAWYYTPMALDYAGHLEPNVCIYDCMDELAAFKGAPPGLIEHEDRLFEAADLVFVGGPSLYEAKRHRHPRTFAFSSSVDAEHFGQARGDLPDPPDQAPIPWPRIGFFGVIDERMDLALVAKAAEACPEIQFVFVGPVVKIDSGELPRGPNLHWLGPKHYDNLPAYLGGWDAGWMPFALNAATRFISPTKTPEFLAAGLPLVSTAVPDVVRGYGTTGMVAIADVDDIAEKLRASLVDPGSAWEARVKAHLAWTSWDRTWAEMDGHIRALREQRRPLKQKGA